jgi:hypothetical protein
MKMVIQCSRLLGVVPGPQVHQEKVSQIFQNFNHQASADSTRRRRGRLKDHVIARLHHVFRLST